VWKIPETPMLLEQRKEIGVDHWSLEGDETVGMLPNVLAVRWHSTLGFLAFAKSVHGTRFQPVSLSQPLFRLNGNLHVPS
jgi:hypothetical protein